jgi:predicted Zn-dependent protease
MPVGTVRISKAVLLFVIAAACPAISLHAQSVSDSAAGFKFTKVDSDLLSEADNVDATFEKKGLVMHDPGLQEYLDKVGKGVLAARPVPEQVEYKFRALRDTMVNAFALPNGTVYVTTGLLALLENEAQLAGILGHETAHVYERHSYLQNRSIRKKALTINILQIVASGAGAVPGSGAVAVFGTAIWAGAQVSSLVLVASVYGYSREMESQADSDGIAAMTSASYDPHGMARAFELLDNDTKLEYEPIETFYHDHPKLTNRRELAVAFADKHSPAQPLSGAEKDYLSVVAPAIAYNINADMQGRRARTALARSSRMASIFPDEPNWQLLMANSYRALGAKSKKPTDKEQTDSGQAEHRKEYFKMTEHEEQARLLKMPEGEAAQRENRAQAEKILFAVIQNHPTYSPAYRDLGFLYEDEGQNAEAAKQYRHYLDIVASTSLDHLRIERRLATLEKLSPSQETPQPH